MLIVGGKMMPSGKSFEASSLDAAFSEPGQGRLRAVSVPAIGKWALEHYAQEEPATRLVGFTLADGYVPTEGSVIVDSVGEPAGQVTSARFSPVLDRVIGMAWVPSPLARDGARVHELAKDPRPIDVKLEELFLTVVARKPTGPEIEAANVQFTKYKKNQRIAFENILWALLNTKEFLFVQ